MQITVTFSSVEEMNEFLDKVKPGQVTHEVSLPDVRREPKDSPAIPEQEVTSDPETIPEAGPEGRDDGTEKRPSYTLIDVRAELSRLTKEGKKEQVQALIRSFGVEKLSAIPEGKYGELMEKAGEL